MVKNVISLPDLFSSSFLLLIFLLIFCGGLAADVQTVDRVPKNQIFKEYTYVPKRWIFEEKKKTFKMLSSSSSSYLKNTVLFQQYFQYTSRQKNFSSISHSLTSNTRLPYLLISRHNFKIHNISFNSNPCKVTESGKRSFISESQSSGPLECSFYMPVITDLMSFYVRGGCTCRGFYHKDLHRVLWRVVQRYKGSDSIILF